jgi:DNA-directed RNA polymerase specialized sigma24 family protein
MPAVTIKRTASSRMGAERRPSAYKGMAELEQASIEPGEVLSEEMERLDLVLLAHRVRFLKVLERRTGSRSDAEEILQAAYVRALERGLPEDGGEGIVAWFRRVLRNAAIDAARRRRAACVRAFHPRACGRDVGRGALDHRLRLRARRAPRAEARVRRRCRTRAQRPTATTTVTLTTIPRPGSATPSPGPERCEGRLARARGRDRPLLNPIIASAP